MMITFPTKPESRAIDPARTAVLVVDMQNAFRSKGGMFDLSGIDIGGAQRLVEVVQQVLDRSRHAGVRVVYLQMGYDAKLASSGGPDSPNWHKELALRLIRQRPELKGKVLTEGQWDWEVVNGLRPHPEDLIVNKTRDSGFYGTPLDSMLRARGICTPFFVGIATNLCVESTLRDAFFLDYWPVLGTGRHHAGRSAAVAGGHGEKRGRVFRLDVDRVRICSHHQPASAPGGPCIASTLT
jgi:ureidoacrylate peracid hydrolase